MKTALLLVVALILATNTTYSAPLTDSTCLRMFIPNDSVYRDSTGYWVGSYNPDSVMIDTCLGSPTYNHLFAKKWYAIQFPKNFYPFHHGLDSDEVKGVSEIDSSHVGLRNRFLELQDTFGLIYFQGLEVPETDSFLMLNPSIRVFFERYQDYRFIPEYFINTIDSVKDVVYLGRFISPIGVKEQLEISFTFVYPNPVKDYFIINPNNVSSYNGIIEIFSIDGKKVLESVYKERINVSMLNSGSYILKINNHSIKFIKE